MTIPYPMPGQGEAFDPSRATPDAYSYQVTKMERDISWNPRYAAAWVFTVEVVAGRELVRELGGPYDTVERDDLVSATFYTRRVVEQSTLLSPDTLLNPEEIFGGPFIEYNVSLIDIVALLARVTGPVEFKTTHPCKNEGDPPKERES